MGSGARRLPSWCSLRPLGRPGARRSVHAAANGAWLGHSSGCRSMVRLTGVVVAVLVAWACRRRGPVAAGTAHASVVSDNPANWTPNVQDDAVVPHTAVYAIHQLGGTMYAGGKFHKVANASQTNTFTRNNLMAFERHDRRDAILRARRQRRRLGAPADRAPSVYVAGSFTSVNGVARRGIVKLDATTGAVDPAFNAHLPSGDRLRRPPRQRTPDHRRQLPRASCSRSTRPPGRTPATSTCRSPARWRPTPAPPTSTASPSTPPARGWSRSATSPPSAGRPATGRSCSTSAPTTATLNAWYYAPLRQHVPGPQAARRTCVTSTSPPTAATSSSPRPGYIPAGRRRSARDLCDAAARFETSRPGTDPADVDQLHRRRHPALGRGHRRSGLRPGPPALAGQPATADDFAGPGRGAARGHRRHRPRHRQGAARGTPARPAASAARTSSPARPGYGSRATGPSSRASTATTLPSARSSSLGRVQGQHAVQGVGLVGRLVVAVAQHPGEAQRDTARVARRASGPRRRRSRPPARAARARRAPSRRTSQRQQRSVCQRSISSVMPLNVLPSITKPPVVGVAGRRGAGWTASPCAGRCPTPPPARPGRGCAAASP